MARKNKTAGFNYNRILFFSFIVLLLSIAGCNTNTNLGNNVNAEPVAYEAKSTGSLQTGDVLIELTPIGIKDGKFEVMLTANTHSVDLSQFDLMQQTILQYDNKEIKPISAPALSGHHTSGELVFNINKMPENFKIEIRSIPNVEERIFEWP